MTRDEALAILEKPPITDDEAKELFTEVAKRLEITEEELQRLYNLPKCRTKFRSQQHICNMGIRLYELLGIEKRIRK